MRNGDKVLVVKPSSLGDIVHSLPVLDALKRTYPDSTVHWVVARGFEGILDGHPLIGKLWIVNKDQWKRIGSIGNTFAELRGLFRSLRQERFDIAIDLQGLLRSGLITGASAAPVRVGFSEAREGSPSFYTQKVAGGREVHAVDRYLKIAAFLGCDCRDVRFPFPPGPEIPPAFPGEPVQGSKEYAVIVPGARGAAKRWAPARFGRVASRLPFSSIVIGSKGDALLASEVVAASSGRAASLAGKTSLMEMTELIRHARFMLCNDTGPMHIAAALGVKVVALFGPTNPARTGPYGSGHTIVRTSETCAPCYRKSCKDPRCMDSIGEDAVVEVIAEFLRQGEEI